MNFKVNIQLFFLSFRIIAIIVCISFPSGNEHLGFDRLGWTIRLKSKVWFVISDAPIFEILYLLHVICITAVVKTTGQPEVAEPAAKRAEERDGWLLALKETYDQIPAHVKAELKKEVRLYNMKKEEERAQQQ